MSFVEAAMTRSAFGLIALAIIVGVIGSRLSGISWASPSHSGRCCAG